MASRSFARLLSILPRSRFFPLFPNALLTGSQRLPSRVASVRALALLGALAVPLPASGQQADLAGAADHPLVGRYEGAVITAHESRAYDEIRLPVTPLERGGRDNRGTWQGEFSGRITSLRYEGPGGRSLLEVMRNHQAELEAKGFAIRLFCRGRDECAPGGSLPDFWAAGRAGIGLPTTWGTTIYLLAERQNAEATVTVAMLGVETKARGDRPLMPHLAVTVVEATPMETGRIAVLAADEMAETLARDGRIAVYGITFEFDSAEITAASADQIAELGRLLGDTPDLAVLIVGHTDGKGGFDYNLSLSQRRAQAVVDRLAAAHGIAAARMTPAGAGMVAPVASNRSEEGRARNRRVEIVEIVR